MIKMSEAATSASRSSEDNDNDNCNPQVAFKEGKPGDLELNELAGKLCTKWNNLGLQLGISQDVLNGIETNGKDRPYEMLLRWRDTTSSNAFYRDLYYALCHDRVGLDNVAKEFCVVSADGPSPPKRTKLEDSPTKQFLEWCLEELQEFYNTKSQVKITPWNPDNTVDIDEIYIQLSMLRDDRKPHGTTKEKLEDYAEMFKGGGRHLNPKRILVYGRPGIGKSTFTQKIAVDWSRGKKEILKRFGVLLLIKLRDVCDSQDFRTMLKTAELLSADDPMAVENLDKYVRENQGNVLLVLDGYDEYNGGKSSPVNQIWRGSVLRGCCVIITTRRVKEEELGKQSHIQLELNGFDSEKQVKEFASKFLSDQKDVEGLLECLRERHLWDMAKIPLLLLMMCLVWKEKDCKGLPTSRADLYSRFMQTLFDHLHSKDSEEEFQSIDEYSEALSRLGELAFYALLENCLDFSSSKLPDDNIFKKFIDSGFLQTSKRSSSFPEKIVYFLHKSVQEFVAAKFIVQELTNKKNESVTCLSKVDSFQKIEQMFEVLKFACGLSSDATCAVLSHLQMIGDQEGLTAYNFTETPSGSQKRFVSICWDCLFSCAASGRQAVFPFFLKCVSNVVILNDPTSEKLTFLKNLLPSIPHPCYIEINGYTFMSYNAGLIESMVANIHFSDKLHSLQLFNINLTSTCVNKIASSLSQTSNLHELDLSENPLYSSVSDLVENLHFTCRVTVLRLSNVNMGEKEAAVLGASLAFINGLEQLDISDNAMGHGIIKLANHLHCVPSLTELYLRNTEMGGEEATAVSQCLPSINQLQTLDLSFNPLGYGIIELAKHLNFVPGLRNLRLADTQMDKEKASGLARALKDVPELFDLGLSDNPLGRGASVLIQHLSSVPQLAWLNLYRVEMTKTEAEELCTAHGRYIMLGTDYHVQDENGSFRLRTEAELEREGYAFADEKEIKRKAESNDDDDDDDDDDDEDEDDDDDDDDADKDDDDVEDDGDDDDADEDEDDDEEENVHVYNSQM